MGFITTYPNATPSVSWMCFTVSLFVSSLMSTQITVAFNFPNWYAIWRPMPCPAPVTNATSPATGLLKIKIVKNVEQFIVGTILSEIRSITWQYLVESYLLSWFDEPISQSYIFQECSIIRSVIFFSSVVGWWHASHWAWIGNKIWLKKDIMKIHIQAHIYY